MWSRLFTLYSTVVGTDPYVGVQMPQGVTDVQQLGFNALPPYWVGTLEPST